MGIALWTACALAVFFVIRTIPAGRPPSLVAELIVSIVAALLLGTAATALDFGGWNEPDWRAALFVLFGTAAVSALVRIVRIVTRRES